MFAIQEWCPLTELVIGDTEASLLLTYILSPTVNLCVLECFLMKQDFVFHMAKKNVQSFVSPGM